MPSWTWANRLGSEDDDSSGLRTWMWTSEAPASNASWVDSICSDGVTGSAGLSFLRGTEPVMATVITMGLAMSLSPLLDLLKSRIGLLDSPESAFFPQDRRSS